MDSRLDREIGRRGEGVRLKKSSRDKEEDRRERD